MKTIPVIDRSELLETEENEQILKILKNDDLFNQFQKRIQFSKSLHELGFLEKESTVWNIGCGTGGEEPLIFSMFGKAQIYGIDKNLKDEHSEYVHLRKGKIEDIIKEYETPQPDLILARRVSGVHRAIEELLSLESQPIMVLRLCDCKTCNSIYFTEEDRIRSEKYRGLINTKDRWGLDLSEMVDRRRIQKVADKKDIITGMSLPYNRFVNPTEVVIMDIQSLIDEQHPNYRCIIHKETLLLFPEDQKVKANTLINPIIEYFQK
jgi:hypothetical protein